MLFGINRISSFPKPTACSYAVNVGTTSKVVTFTLDIIYLYICDNNCSELGKKSVLL